MPLPVTEKTWVHNVNNEVQTGAWLTDTQEILFRFVRFLIDDVGCTPLGTCFVVPWNGTVPVLA